MTVSLPTAPLQLAPTPNAHSLQIVFTYEAKPHVDYLVAHIVGGPAEHPWDHCVNVDIATAIHREINWYFEDYNVEPGQNGRSACDHAYPRDWLTPHFDRVFDPMTSPLMVEIVRVWFRELQDSLKCINFSVRELQAPAINAWLYSQRQHIVIDS